MCCFLALTCVLRHDLQWAVGWKRDEDGADGTGSVTAGCCGRAEHVAAGFVEDMSCSRARRQAAEVVGDASRSRAGRRAAVVVEDASRSRAGRRAALGCRGR